MKTRTLFASLAVAGLLLGTGAAHAGSDYTFIDFRGNDGHAYSHTFSEGGLSVTATGGSFDWDNKLVTDGVKVGQWSHGLGVKNSPGDNSHTVDGSGWDDVLFLNFDSTVWLKRIYFGYTGKDQVKVWTGDLAEVVGTYEFNYFGGGYYYVDLPGQGVAGNSFGLEAPTRRDSWKVAGVKAHPVPSPVAGLAGMALLGLVVTARRRLA